MLPGEGLRRGGALSVSRIYCKQSFPFGDGEFKSSLANTLPIPAASRAASSPPSSLCIPASRHLPWGWHLSPPEVPRAHPCWCLSPAWAEPWLWLLSLGLARKFASCHIIPLVDPVGSCLCLCKWRRRNPCSGETCGQIAMSFSSLVLPTQLGSPGCLLRGCLCQRRWQSVIRERVTPSLALSWDRADHSPCPHS